MARKTDRPWPPEPKWVELEGCDIEHTTDLAILIIHEAEEFWVPKSQIQDPEQFEDRESDCTVLVNEWFARQKGLI